MSERIIVYRHAGEPPRFLRADTVAGVSLERHGAGAWCVVAELLGATPSRILADGLEELEAAALWEALRDWYGHRGGLQFDVQRWQREQRELERASRGRAHA